ncbi:DUF1542 domain-containing protein [Nocardia huaxiensis]|uniref:DUF1542 domain-containing protein n=1 Tax=Nocardia huaxiensis TaxID=2755382 RepID=A0A7D6VAC4_9NOCA|nr:DUF1542 domain-containing protein [Nocardia huaxiensis]QLY30271.1 DUF1542 domain-containing protein [Nocardia huaxiensis]
MTTVVVLLIAMVIVLAAVLAVNATRRSRNDAQLADAKADARRLIERLGGQVYNLTGTDAPSKQALADAGERFNAAGSQIEQATTLTQARLAKETAAEGLYYVRAARTAMGMDPGPAVPELDGQRTAGRVTEDRTVDFDGRQLEASPTPSARTPNYYPGGRVAGRPVPAGWYSEPWWRTALVAGAWGVGSVLLFDALFNGMSGVGYDAAAFENGYDDGFQAGLDAGNDNTGDPGSYDGGDYDGGNSYDQGAADPGFDPGLDQGWDAGGFDGGGFDSFDSGF